MLGHSNFSYESTYWLGKTVAPLAIAIIGAAVAAAAGPSESNFGA
jgi:hypothetical protein